MRSSKAVRVYREHATAILAVAPQEIVRSLERRRFRIVRGQGSPVNAYSQRSRRIWSRYEIVINVGWDQFLMDATHFFLSRAEVRTHATNTTALAAPLASPDFQSILKTTVANYLKTSAWEPALPLVLKQSTPTPSWARLTFPVFERQEQLLHLMRCFSIAHELGHIVLGHCDDRATDPALLRRQEYEADVVALDLLLSYLQNGTRYHPYSQRTTYFFDGRFVDPEDELLVVALGATAIVFALIDLWFRAASEIKEQWHSYPSGLLRYLALRRRCIEDGLIRRRIRSSINAAKPEWIFAYQYTGFPPPDDVMTIFQYHGAEIHWTSDRDDSNHPAATSLDDSHRILTSLEEKYKRGEPILRELEGLRRAVEPLMFHIIMSPSKPRSSTIA